METRRARVYEIDISKHPSKARSIMSMINRFRRFIEYNDWDERMLVYEKWVDGFCWGSLAVIVVYLLPAILHIIQR